jgi:hypothetical protein
MTAKYADRIDSAINDVIEEEEESVEAAPVYPDPQIEAQIKNLHARLSQSITRLAPMVRVCSDISLLEEGIEFYSYLVTIEYPTNFFIDGEFRYNRYSFSVAELRDMLSFTNRWNKKSKAEQEALLATALTNRGYLNI